MRRDRKPDATLSDRVALALLSGLAVLGLGGLLWFALNYFLATVIDGPLISFGWVLGLAVTFALIGFTSGENVVVKLITALARMLGRLLPWLSR